MNTNEISNKYFLPVSVVVAGLLIAGAVIWNGSRPVDSAAPTQEGTVSTEGAPFIGNANAPVTIASWSDYQCSFCKKFEVETLPQIVKDYVDTGKVKIVFMDLTFLGSDSNTAAVYGRSVWKLYPSQYFAWRMAMYVAQDEGQDMGFGDETSIDKLNATIAGIDATKVAADVKANKNTYEAQINVDKTEAQKVGINATPSFVIGKEVIKGAYPYATFQAAIDATLK